MIDINEDEIDRLFGKLVMLGNCMRIKKLGYIYEEGTYITIDTRADEDGYGGIDQVEFLGGLLGTSIGTGYCGTNEYMKDELISIGGKIPYSTYDKDCINGLTVKIENPDIDKLIKYKLNNNDFINKFIQLFTENCCMCEESTVTDVQIIFNDYIYIIVPEEYFMIDMFFETYCIFLEEIREKVEFYEKQLNVQTLNEKEVA
jgi:hypothetical protein